MCIQVVQESARVVICSPARLVPTRFNKTLDECIKLVLIKFNMMMHGTMKIKFVIDCSDFSTVENKSIQRRTSPSANAFTTNSTWNILGSNPSLCCEKSAT